MTNVVGSRVARRAARLATHTRDCKSANPRAAVACNSGRRSERKTRSPRLPVIVDARHDSSCLLATDVQATAASLGEASQVP